MYPQKLICINDSNRPDGIPISKWVKKGEPYTAIGVIKCNAQGGVYGYILEEIDLTGCDPYICFATFRFGMPIEPVKIEETEEILEIA